MNCQLLQHQEKQKQLMNLMTDCKLEFFPSITKTPPTSWISNLVPVSLCDSWCCFRFLFFSHNIVFLICVSPRSLWHQSHGPKSSWHLGGRTLSTHAPSQRLRIQHVNHVDTSIASMVSWVSLQRIGSTRAKPNSSACFLEFVFPY